MKLTSTLNLKGFEGFQFSEHDIDDAKQYLTKFFCIGVIKYCDIDENMLKIKFQVDHELIYFVNIEICINEANLICNVVMSDGFHNRILH